MTHKLGDPSLVAVMLGGGVESTALVDRCLRRGQVVCPVHVHCGLLWDDAEAEHVNSFCRDRRRQTANLLELVDIRISLAGFLGDHWAQSGDEFPRAGDSSNRLEIPLRNLLLLGLAVHRLKRHPAFESVPELVLATGTTADNHFADGSRDYFDRCEPLLSLEAHKPVRISTPWIASHKADVIRESGPDVLALSFSCVAPMGLRHCGRCVKCDTRRQAFREANRIDPTDYAMP